MLVSLLGFLTGNVIFVSFFLVLLLFYHWQIDESKHVLCHFCQTVTCFLEMKSSTFTSKCMLSSGTNTTFKGTYFSCLKKLDENCQSFQVFFRLKMFGSETVLQKRSLFEANGVSFFFHTNSILSYQSSVAVRSLCMVFIVLIVGCIWKDANKLHSFDDLQNRTALSVSKF